MSYCTECGQKNDAAANFCGGCGISLKNHKSKKSSHSENQPEPRSRQENSDSKNFYWWRDVLDLFNESDPRNISSNYLTILALGLCLSLFLRQILWQKSPEDLSFQTELTVSFIIYGVYFFLVRFAVKKNNVRWLVPLFVLYVSSWVLTFYSTELHAELQQKISVVLGPNMNGWKIAGGLYDLFLGDIVEFILLVRLYASLSKSEG